jgi:ribosome-binding protein aMBF1 (putative translation factor)
MTKKLIPAETAFAEWRRNPDYAAAYDALEDEFALAEALIQARGAARMTQEQVAEKMGTTQAQIAKMEGGRTIPSTRTLQRFAEATGTRLRISFERTDPTASR